MELEEIMVREVREVDKNYVKSLKCGILKHTHTHKTKKKMNSQKPRTDCWLPNARIGKWVQQVGEGGESAQAFTCKISKSWGYDVQHADYIQQYCIVYMK